ncbi:hypothetical protein BGZ65_012626, partial [Modicella reniformis]
MSQGLPSTSPGVSLTINNLAKHTEHHKQLGNRDFMREFIERLPERAPKPSEKPSSTNAGSSNEHSSHLQPSQQRQAESKSKRKRPQAAEVHPHSGPENIADQSSSVPRKGIQSSSTQDPSRRAGFVAKEKQDETKTITKRRKQSLDIDADIKNLDINKSVKGSQYSNGRLQDKSTKAAPAAVGKRVLDTGKDKPGIQGDQHVSDRKDVKSYPKYRENEPCRERENKGGTGN